MNTSQEHKDMRSVSPEKELAEKIRKNCERRKYLYDNGKDTDIHEYRRLETELVGLIEQYEKARGAKHYTIRTHTKGTIRR